jgi:hypothetical protein
MSVISVLPTLRAFASPMLVKTLSIGMTCAAVIVCCAVYGPTPAASAMQIPIGTPAAVKGAYMTFAAGSDAEPPPWPENLAPVESKPVIVASVAPAVVMPLVRRLVPHAVSLGTARDGTAMAVVWNQ